MTRRIGIIALGLAGAAVALALSQPAQADSLSDALVEAYRSSPILEQQRYLLRASDEDVAVAVSAMRPVVSLTATASRAFNNYNLPLQRSSNTDSALALVLDYTLLDGGQRSLRIAAAKEGVLGARFGLVQFEQQVLLNAVTAYFNLRLAVRIVGVRESNVNVLEQQLRASQDRFEVGEVTRTDVAISQTRLSASQSALAAARGQVDIAREAYRQAVGRLPGPTLDAPPASPAIPPDVDRAQALSLQIHPLISAGQHNIVALTLLSDAAGRDRLPSIGLGAQIGDRRDLGQDLNLSITGQAPIYTGGRLPALQRQAIARAQASRGDLGNTSRGIVQDVGNAYAQLEVARAQITATQQGVLSAQLAFEGFREEALLGARTTLDVLDSEQELLNARTDQLQAESDAQLAVYRVLAAIGLLTTEHLGLSVERYDPTGYYNSVADAPLRIDVQPSAQGNRLDSVLKRFNRN